MTTRPEKRNADTGIATPPDGVGDRHAPIDRPPWGGGYLNKCTILKFGDSEKKRDPRLLELAAMGLQQVWLQVAEEVGVDNFLKIWRILDTDISNIGNDGRILVPLRGYAGYLRFQRNRYIEALTEEGFSPNQIKDRLQAQLCEKISTRHISRIQKAR